VDAAAFNYRAAAKQMEGENLIPGKFSPQTDCYFAHRNQELLSAQIEILSMRT
jgi:hypothetical protein